MNGLETIPMKIVSANVGKVNMEVKADDLHVNPQGGVHGGFAAIVIDSVTRLFEILYQANLKIQRSI